MKLSRLILRQQLGSALPFCCNKSPRQRNVQSDLTLHFRVGGYQFSSIYVIVFKSLRLQRVHTYPDSLRFQKFPLWRPFSKVCGYSMRFRRIRVDAKRNRNKMLADTNESGYVWTGPVTELKKRSADCEFEQLRDSLVRDITICGINDNRLRERLLREPDLTLQKAIQLGHAAEETKRHLKELQKETDGKNFVDDVSKNTEKRKNKFSKESIGYDKSYIKNCKFCSYSHKRGNCTAYGKKCRNCSKSNHFAKCCQENPKFVRRVQCDSSDSDECYAGDNTFFVGSIVTDDNIVDDEEKRTVSDENDLTDKNDESNNNEFTIFAIGSESESEWTVDMDTNGSNVRFKLDTGAQVNMLPNSQYDKLLRRPKLKSTKVKLTAYNGTNIPVVGRCIARIAHKKSRDVPVMFVVAETSSPPILGLSTCENLNLIKRVMMVKSKEENVPSFMSEFDYCFGELDTLPKVHKITVNPNVPPVVDPPRRVPIALQPKLKEELDRMERLGVVSVTVVSICFGDRFVRLLTVSLVVYSWYIVSFFNIYLN